MGLILTGRKTVKPSSSWIIFIFGGVHFNNPSVNMWVGAVLAGNPPHWYGGEVMRNIGNICSDFYGLSFGVVWSMGLELYTMKDDGRRVDNSVPRYNTRAYSTTPGLSNTWRYRKFEWMDFSRRICENLSIISGSD